MENNNNGSMTALMYQYATGGYLTLEEASSKLHSDAYIRTVGETLARYCGVSENDQDTLCKKVTELLLESNPSAKRDSVNHNVRLWLKNKKQFISRESALQIIFALKLKPDPAEEVLRRLCGEGFHRRDPEDMILLFALDKNMSYPEFLALSERLADVCRLPENAPENESSLTESVRQTLEQIHTEEELRAYLKENAPFLGKLHNTAFMLFREFIGLLKSPGNNEFIDDADDRDMSVGEIVMTYLYNDLIPNSKKGSKKKKADEIVRDSIRANWPDEYSISRMINRRTDVTRKVLILLFLACDGGESSYGDYSDETADDVFQDTYARMNSMLTDCGFSPLDSRIPFDWMVLYCMVADDLTDIDENILEFLTAVFNEEGQ